MTTISDLGKVLMTHSFDAKYISLNICIDLIIVSIMLELIGILVLWQPLDTKSNDHTTSKSLKADI